MILFNVESGQIHLRRRCEGDFRVVSYGHCPHWRHLVWLTPSHLILLDTWKNELVLRPRPKLPIYADEIVSIDFYGFWKILGRREDQTWKSAAEHNPIFYGRHNEEPSTVWGWQGMGPLVLSKIRLGQTREEQLRELSVTRGHPEHFPPGVLGRHPEGTAHLALGLHGGIELQFVRGPFRGEFREIAAHEFYSWTRLSGAILWKAGFAGVVGAIEKSSTPLIRSFYPYKASFCPKGERPEGAMESSKGGLWHIRYGFLQQENL